MHFLYTEKNREAAPILMRINTFLVILLASSVLVLLTLLLTCSDVQQRWRRFMPACRDRQQEQSPNRTVRFFLEQQPSRQQQQEEVIVEDCGPEAPPTGGANQLSDCFGTLSDAATLTKREQKLLKKSKSALSIAHCLPPKAAVAAQASMVGRPQKDDDDASVGEETDEEDGGGFEEFDRLEEDVEDEADDALHMLEEELDTAAQEVQKKLAHIGSAVDRGAVVSSNHSKNIGLPVDGYLRPPLRKPRVSCEEQEGCSLAAPKPEAQSQHCEQMQLV